MKAVSYRQRNAFRGLVTLGASVAVTAGGMALIAPAQAAPGDLAETVEVPIWTNQDPGKTINKGSFDVGGLFEDSNTKAVGLKRTAATYLCNGVSTGYRVSAGYYVAPPVPTGPNPEYQGPDYPATTYGVPQYATAFDGTQQQPREYPSYLSSTWNYLDYTLSPINQDQTSADWVTTHDSLKGIGDAKAAGFNFSGDPKDVVATAAVVNLKDNKDIYWNVKCIYEKSAFFSQTNFAFGAVAVGVVKTLPLSIYNSTSLPVTMQVTKTEAPSTSSNDFSVDVNAGQACSISEPSGASAVLSVDPGVTCVGSMSFAPTQDAGSVSAAVAISSQQFPDKVLQLAASGNAGSGPLKMTPKDLGDVGVGDVEDKKIKVTNTSSRNVTIENSILDGPGKAVYNRPKSEDKCSGKTLSPGKKCQLFVRFKPTVAANQAVNVILDTSNGSFATSAIGNASASVQAPSKVTDLTVPNKYRKATKARGDWYAPEVLGTAVPNKYQTRLKQKPNKWGNWSKKGISRNSNGKFKRTRKNLTPNKRYVMQVRAVSAAGQGKKVKVKFRTKS
jgi:hypothetical protein